MKIGVPVGIVVSLLLTVSRASAGPCYGEDRLVGPNCIRSGEVPKTEFSANESPMTVSWVYRLVNGFPVTVWQGIGRVIVSAPDRLRIHVKFTPKAGEDGIPKTSVDYQYNVLWDGKTYSRRGF